MAAEEAVYALKNDSFEVSQADLGKYYDYLFKRTNGKVIIHKDQYFVKQINDFYKISTAF